MAFPLSYFIFILPAVLGIILSLAVFIIKKKKNEKEKEKKNEKQSNETETVTELGRMLKELLNDYQKQARAAVDEEAGKLQEQTETVTELAKMMRETLADFQKQAGISKNNNQTVERLSEDMLEQEKPHRFSSQLLQNFTSNYSTKLVEGGYGAVYKGRFPNGRQLAVKVLINNPGIGNNSTIDEFMAEVNTIGRTNHRNLVKLFGYCFEPNTKALVYEYMENGSLDKFLFEKKNKNIIEWDKLYEIAIGSARGLEYLHHFCNRRIIHYDIKPANVLLDSNFCPKIADFGLAKLCHGNTSGYAAPEVYMSYTLSYKCDVYSFGVMLFEIVGKRRNFIGESQEWFPKQVWEKFDKGELEEILVNCDIEEKYWEKAKRMVMVALWCMQYLPEGRPSMRDVVKILEGGAQAFVPPNPFQHLMPSADSCMVNGSSSSATDHDDHQDETDDTMIMRKYEIHYATS